MRSFIGLDLSPQDKLALASWRERAFPGISAKKPDLLLAPGQKSPPVAVPPENYHVTLAFLGDITNKQHDALLSELDTLSNAPFDITLNTTGIWDGPKILYAAPLTVAPQLRQLAKSVRQCARTARINVESREYKPHVTLVRKASNTLPPPLMAPELTFSCRAFHFFESLSTPSGVRYPIRHSWSLRPDMSVREQLKQGLI